MGISDFGNSNLPAPLIRVSFTLMGPALRSPQGEGWVLNLALCFSPSSVRYTLSTICYSESRPMTYAARIPPSSNSKLRTQNSKLWIVHFEQFAQGGRKKVLKKRSFLLIFPDFYSKSAHFSVFFVIFCDFLPYFSYLFYPSPLNQPCYPHF